MYFRLKSLTPASPAAMSGVAFAFFAKDMTLMAVSVQAIVMCIH
jgi:hypothetical protein